MGCRKMKKKSSKLATLERNRWSVFTDNLNWCYFCGKPIVEKHEILYGTNRVNSMKWGYVLPLCRFHHEMFHNNHKLTLEWQIKCQDHFCKEHSLKEWLEIFHTNYKYKKTDK